MGKEDFDRGKDVIKSEDFEKLEEKENKKSLIKRFMKKKTEKEKDKKEERVITPAKLTESQVLSEFYALNEKFDQIHIQVEKLGGKLELEQGSQVAFGERLMELSSQLGELRSVIVSKSKFFDLIEEQFNQIVDEMKSIKPEKIQEQLEKYHKRLVTIEATIERNNSRTEQLEKEIFLYRNQMAKIESFEALLDSLKNNQLILKEINNSKTMIERFAAKSEFIYSELNDKLTRIDYFDGRINSNENSLRELIKGMDKTQMKLGNMAAKSEVATMKQQVSQIKKAVFKKDMEKFFSLFKKTPGVIPDDAIKNISTENLPVSADSAAGSSREVDSSQVKSIIEGEMEEMKADGEERKDVESPDAVPGKPEGYAIADTGSPESVEPLPDAALASPEGNAIKYANAGSIPQSSYSFENHDENESLETDIHLKDMYVSGENPKRGELSLSERKMKKCSVNRKGSDQKEDANKRVNKKKKTQKTRRPKANMLRSVSKKPSDISVGAVTSIQDPESYEKIREIDESGANTAQDYLIGKKPEGLCDDIVDFNEAMQELGRKQSINHNEEVIASKNDGQKLLSGNLEHIEDISVKPGFSDLKDPSHQTIRPDSFWARFKKKNTKNAIPESTLMPLVTFIRTKKNEGFTMGSIREAVLKKGWPEHYIDRCMDYVS